MKVTNKTINIAAGITFLWQAAAGIWSMLQQVMWGNRYHFIRLYSVIDLYGIVVLTVIGCVCFASKKAEHAAEFPGFCL